MELMALVNRFGDCVSTTVDPFNLNKERGNETEGIMSYNCGGYALETYNWFLPFFSSHNFSHWIWREVCKTNHWEYDEDGLENGDTEGEIIYDEYEQRIIEDLVSTIMNLNPLTDEEEAYDFAYEIFTWGYWDEPAAIALSIRFMLNAFPTMREVNDFSELKNNEYGIAYACGGGDFHFIKFKNGVYTHKMGAGDIQETDNIEKTFRELGYDSEIFYFAKEI